MIRDERSKALINNDASALNKYKLERDRMRKLENVSKEIAEIKSLLSSVCDRLKKLESV